MRTALLLLLALAIAAVPGSIIPQSSADPNGVAEWKLNNPAGSRVIQALQGFDVYSSVWFSAIYLLLFLSLIGCVVPRLKHHLAGVRAAPPRTPSRFERLPARAAGRLDAPVAPALDAAERVLRRRGYRTARYGSSVSAERGYLRESGNLLFHLALLGVLVAVFVGGGFTFTGQRVLVTGDTFVNNRARYDSLTSGRFFTADALQPYALRLDRLDVRYETGRAGFGQPIDYTAHVTTTDPGQRPQQRTVKVNEPLDIGGTAVYLLGNGYAPHITVRNPDGTTAFSAPVVFQPQGPKLISLGVVKVRNTTGPQIGLQGILYPTVTTADGRLDSIFPNLGDPLLTLSVYKGRIGTGAESAFLLDTSGGKLVKVAGQDTGTPGIALSREKPTATLPDGLGTVTLDGITRYAAFDIHHDPSQGWVALFVALAVLGLITSLLVPRRRMWVKLAEREDGGLDVEYAGLARGDDPGLLRAVEDLQRDHRAALPPPAVREPAGV